MTEQAAHIMRKPSRDATCDKRIDFHLEGRLSDLGEIQNGIEAGDNAAFERLTEYGLCFDYIAPDTFPDQPEAYFRYQLSWGGPSDEFRFFVNPDFSFHRAEYWFLDWFDGACRCLMGSDAALLRDLWRQFEESGKAFAAFRRAER